VSTAAQFAPLLADPAGALVACDYDGTLAHIVDDPDAAVPAPGAVEALQGLARRVGHLAVITGRPAADLVRLGRLERVPGLVVLGLYGRQRWQAGALLAADPPPELVAAERAVRGLISRDGPGLRLEHKGASLAVHSRQAADPVGGLERVRPALTEIAREYGLRVSPGRLVLELVPAGVHWSDKGFALEELAAEVAASCVLYAGDDVGDLPAFQACARLRSAGATTWSVAAANDEAPQVAGLADVVVDGPDGVVALLTALVKLLG